MRFEHKLNTYNNDCLIAETENDIGFENWDDFPEKGLHKEVSFRLLYKELATETRIGNFHFSPMPGCCGIVVSHHTMLDKNHRGTHISEGFRKLKEALARKLGYSMMIATTQMKNIPAVKNMFKSNYEIPVTFINFRTTELLGLGYKLLK